MNWLSAFLLVFAVSPMYADCVGPPSEPVVKIRIKSCEIARQYDDTLKVTGDARQLLSIYWGGVKGDGHREVIRASGDIPEKVFWMSAYDNSCAGVAKEKDRLWIYGDICNDTFRNVPSIQLQALPPDMQSMAIEALKAPGR